MNEVVITNAVSLIIISTFASISVDAWAAKQIRCSNFLSEAKDIFELGTKSFVETDRLNLRSLIPNSSDEEYLERLMGDAEVKATWVSAGLWHDKLVQELKKDWSQGARQWPDSDNRMIRLDLIIAEKASGKLVGALHATLFEASKKIQLGYEIAAEARHQGYATEAARGLINYVERVRGPSYFFAWVSRNNHESKNVLLKLGFAAGELSDESGDVDQFYFKDPLLRR